MTDQLQAHSALGASGAARWLACPGSVRAEISMPDPPSEYAEQGTAAHELAERCLKDGRDAAELIGVKIQTKDWPTPFTVDEDMAEAVQVYLDYCRNLMDLTDEFWIEQRISLASLASQVKKDDPVHTMFGTCDFSALVGNTLFVVDYKHGAGVFVDVKGNVQLRYYALGAYLALDKATRERVQRIEYVIVQPRASGGTEGEQIRVEGILLPALVSWAADTLLPGARATAHPDASRIPGDHCRFCRALPTCEAARSATMKDAQLVFSESSGELEPAVLPTALSLEQMGQVLEAAPRIQAWVDAVNKAAHDMLERGMVTPQELGWKLVPKRAYRKWVHDEEEVLVKDLAKALKLPASVFYDRKLKSPPQVEKVLPDKEAKAELAKWYKQESSGTTLAPLADKRPDVTPKLASAKAVFEEADAADDFLS